jgi:hypothetical protein
LKEEDFGDDDDKAEEIRKKIRIYEREKYAKFGDWTCKNCKNENYSTEHECSQCSFDRMFCLKDHGMPGEIWQYLRSSYKSKIILDKPEQIPEHVAKHLRSDMERFAYKMAKRAVQICLNNSAWDTKYMHPQDLQKDLNDLDMNASSESIRKGRIYDYLEEIYWNACINLSDCMVDDMDGYLDLLLISRYRAGYEEVKKERLEKFKTKQGTYQIKGSKGDTYWVNTEDQICTCPGFIHHRHCKHLKRKKFVIAAKPPNANNKPT